VAGDRAVREVFVDGRQVVAEGRCTTIDLDHELDQLEAAQARSLERVSTLDHAGRDAETLSPMVFGRG
ncbi:MAG: N-ethylammeline chlorohydrolase, partial [Pseudomonadota bacterium]|nr:N-ethylammeline chlorohydrolase [Pseudomonadota bacterium]